VRRTLRLAAVTLAVAAGGLLAAPGARADQLAWISATDAVAAASRVAPDSLVLAYCSECNERVEVWRVRKAEVVPTAEKAYFQVRVTVRRLFRSRSVIARGEYREPVEYEPAVAKRPDGSDLETTANVDLAYVYVPEAAGRFRVLGKVMGFPCNVAVETVTLPPDVLKAAETAGRDAMDLALSLARAYTAAPDTPTLRPTRVCSVPVRP
jgi:hypothetical protein